MMDPFLNSPFRIWIVEDDDELRETLGKTLTQESREIRLFSNGKELLEQLKGGPSFDIIIADLLMPEVDGLQVLEKSKEYNPDGVVIIMTGYASLDTAIQAIRGGAYDYIRKPFKLDELEVIVKNACEKISLMRENRRLLQRLKETMEEVKGVEKTLSFHRSPRESSSSTVLDYKISEMDVLLNQMIPPNFDLRSKEHQEKTLQQLQKLIEYKKQGFLNEAEFSSLKKMLFSSFKD